MIGRPKNQGMAQPNIIFILIDDLGWRDLGCYGSSFYETPNLDRMAEEGLRFTDAYASCPVCSPTRASVMTGKYPATVGITNYIGGDARGKLIDVPYLHELPASEKTIAQSLQEAGYTTWHVGKWHLGERDVTEYGFDVNVGGCHWGMPKKGFFSPWDIPGLANGDDGEYLTDHLTDKTVELIGNHAPERPFFLHLSHYAVHTPIQAKEADIEKYRQKARDMGLADLDPMEVGEYFPCDHKKEQRVTRRKFQGDPVYAAMVENLDWNLGRVFSALEERGLTENTLIIFTSDNGGLATAEGSPTCNAPLAEGKGWMYEGGTREPLLIKWPGIVQPGSTCDVPVTTTDFYPTMLEAAGAPLHPPQHCDGVSLMPLLRGESELKNREAIFWHYPHYGNQGGTPGCSVRAGDYKLIEFFEDGRLELYNLRQDPGEKHNLAETDNKRCADLHQRLINWRSSVHAKIPEHNPDWQPYDPEGEPEPG